MSDEVEEESGRISKARTFFSDFSVEVFGGFLPGLLFVVGALTALVPATYTIYVAYSQKENFITFAMLNDLIGAIKNTPGTLWFFIFMGFSSLVYILGHLYHRRDPKTPDQRSFEKLRKDEIIRSMKCTGLFEAIGKMRRGKVRKRKFLRLLCNSFFGLQAFFDSLENILFCLSLEDLKLMLCSELKEEAATQKWNDLEQSLKENYACVVPDACKYPYPFMDEYLRKRQLIHLIDFVPWKDGNTESRSKSYINILKIRLHHFKPRLYSTLTKQEAHIRLASSTWYVASNLESIVVRFSIVLFCISFLLRGLQRDFPPLKGMLAHYFIPFLLTFAVYLVANYSRKRIEQFFHYQRLREVVFVYETAYTAFKDDYDLLDPPFRDLAQNNPPRFKAFFSSHGQPKER